MSYGGSSGGGSGRISTSADVALNSPTNYQVLAYDATTEKWKNDDLASKVQTTGGGMEVVVTANTGATYTANLSNANCFALTLTANCTLNLTGATAGKACSVTLILKQDATGSRTVNWPASVKWSGGTAPTLTSTAAKTDFIGLLSIDGGSTWYGFISGLNY